MLLGLTTLLNFILLGNVNWTNLLELLIGNIGSYLFIILIFVIAIFIINRLATLIRLVFIYFRKY